jgi:hypothetical protein
MTDNPVRFAHARMHAEQLPWSLVAKSAMPSLIRRAGQRRLNGFLSMMDGVPSPVP